MFSVQVNMNKVQIISEEEEHCDTELLSYTPFTLSNYVCNITKMGSTDFYGTIRIKLRKHQRKFDIANAIAQRELALTFVTAVYIFK